jgi:pimeloyl-ACP methyl ester carboxylesterase
MSRLPLSSRRRLIGAALGGFSLVALQPLRSAHADESFAVQDFDWEDPVRNRNVPVRVYLPADKSAPKPLVVFSHGLGGSRMGYSYLSKHLAAAGYICVHPQHAGSDRAVWTGNPISLFSNLTKAATDSNAVDRAKDVSFVLDRLLAGPLAQQIDAKRIAVAGHSYGANTAMLVSGATVQTKDGTIYQLRDERVRCAVIISAPPFHGSGDMNPILGGIAISSLHITGTEDVIRVPGYGSSLPARIEVFDAMSSNNEFAKRKHLFVFDGATHGVFTDRIDRVGPTLSAKIKKGTSELVELFLDMNLRSAKPNNLVNYLSANKTQFSEVRLGN